MVKTVISTVYSGEAVKLVLSTFKPDKMVFLLAKDSNPDDETKIRKVMGSLSRAFPKVQFEEITSTMYDLVDVTKTVVDAIKKEKGNQVYLHVTEGRKTMSLGMLYAGYVKKHDIEGAYYAVEENYNMLKLPLPDFSITSSKKEILLMIKKGMKPKDIVEKTKKSTAIVYAHIKEMKKEGYLTEDNELTDAGKIVLM